jgi:hypothetical protein
MVVLCLDMCLIDAPFLFLRSIISTGGEPTASLLTRGYQYFATTWLVVQARNPYQLNNICNAPAFHSYCTQSVIINSSHLTADNVQLNKEYEQ